MLVVCTFASKEYAGSASALRHTALRAGGADGVVVYGEREVEPWFRQNPHISRSSRGFGWWSWKPWVILNTLRQVEPGDVVAYCDAAMTVEAPLHPLCDFEHVRLFRLNEECTNIRWTKPDAFELMGVTPETGERQLNAAVQLYRHTPQAIAFLERLVAWCSRTDVLDDTHRLRRPPPEFVDHRHDQSVVSLLARGCPDVDVVDDAALYSRVEHHRRRLAPVKVAVVTGTTGSPHLEECIASVQAQDLPNVEHYVVVDGPQHAEAVERITGAFKWREPVHVVRLPHNTGGGGYNAHMIYAAMPWLVEPGVDLVCFLDEDNALEPEHVRLLARGLVGAGARWAHSLRRIVDARGREVCPDNCESLGGLCHTVLGRGDRLVDTSCYMLRREVAMRASPVWNLKARDESGREVDRELARVLLAEPHVCVPRHTVRYRAGNTPTSVKPEFFVAGNKAMGYDFEKPNLYVFLLTEAATASFIRCRRSTDRSYALDEWQQTLLRGLDGEYNLLDGYACQEHIPAGAAVVCVMWHPDALPMELFKSRTDLWRVVYMLESPNIRHAQQWDPSFLAAHFDAVLTYWEPMLKDPRVNTLFCPHNTHHLDFGNPLDVAQLRENRGEGRSCAMVLECRRLRGAYSVPNTGVELRCLDFMRDLVRELRDVTVFGKGWAPVPGNPGFKVGSSCGKPGDTRHAVDILQGHVFAVVVENCDAEGYASEKLYDALMAGCIPLYYGSVPARLGIPEGPEDGVYADIRPIVGEDPEGGGRRLQAFIDSLGDERVTQWRQRVVALREIILRKVDVASFADAVRAALAQKPV